ncbi:MAG TPA: VOC family protein [Arachnia sp.]|nr:VOC family protein [Arachnia sp.]HMT85828.1 VOC family protein [Arachnia sp.]
MNETPGIRGIHHVTLSVTELDGTIDWFHEVLGFELLTRVTHNGLDKALCRLGSTIVTFVDHGETRIEGPFDEHRVGLDHLSFAVDATAVEAWGRRLDELGVTRSEIVDGLNGRVLSFRGPENIALEFYTLPV